MRKTLFACAMCFITLLAVFSTGHSFNNSAPSFECFSCHAATAATATLKIEGLPKDYVPGKTYPLTLTIISDMKSDGEVQGGFAFTVSAGTLIPMDKKNTQLSGDYVTHTQEGSALRTWKFSWKAPAKKAEAEVRVMAIAANGDFSATGDAIAAENITLKPKK